MGKVEKWQALGHHHPLWELLRLYLARKGQRARDEWLSCLSGVGLLFSSEEFARLDPSIPRLLTEYINEREGLVEDAKALLRSEEEALEFCRINGLAVGQTRTQNAEHHQSSKALIAAVSGIAQRVCTGTGTTLDTDPQNRCVWNHDSMIHVTARNLDGAVPGLVNPKVIWEIKEYWGKTKGGSKMSDAVYECQLVGKELRSYEEKACIRIYHMVFLDGREQWLHRLSDLGRFIDLLCQGLIDDLFIGRDVELRWEECLGKIVG